MVLGPKDKIEMVPVASASASEQALIADASEPPERTIPANACAPQFLSATWTPKH